MVEHQSCVTLMNASTLCAIEQQVKGENNADAVAEISAELEKERQKNAELIEKISILEAQIRERDTTETQENNQHAGAGSFNTFKRQKIEIVDNEIENKNIVKSEHKPVTEAGIVPDEINPPKSLINWMRSMDDDDSQNMDSEKLKDSDSAAVFFETDSDDNYVNDIVNGQRHDEIDNNTIETANAQNGYLADHIDDESNVTRMESCSGHENQKTSSMLHAPLSEKVEEKGKEIKETTEEDTEALVRVSSHNRKPRKVAFCPKEVKRIIECECLLEKNAQSHTIRKIIVFASLGIRHGCEDMYELDLNHFTILNKGEPYVSPRNPGEHVLYENPGVRRKMFYPNRQNPALCPVQILEEERAMRPRDASCPSCLFLCIKYGGRTRNLPQNEYVRQRMGRNKLKSFGPLMCRMALLVHIRTGSFFFKALGITLLFMAGFPNDLVQRETKYRNLDLLQKYYRTDQDAEGEELFLSHPTAFKNDNGSDEHHNSTKKTLPTKSRGRKQASSSSNIKSHNLQKTAALSSVSEASQFGLTGYPPSHTYAMTAFHSMPSHPISQDTFPTVTANVSGNHSSYHILPPLQTQLASSFVPVMYWPPPTAFLPAGHYPSTFGYQSFPSTANYMSFQTRPYYNHPIPTCNISLSKLLQSSGKNDSGSDETKSDCHSSSGGSTTKHKQGTKFHK